jgi:lipoate---protein ligase
MPAGHPLCFSTPLENYRFVNQGVLEAIRPLLPCCSAAGLFPSIQTDVFCMARPTIYDLILDGKKIAGAAQRRRKNGYLHQGTISLVAPEPILLQKLVSKEIAELMIICSCSLTELPQLGEEGVDRNIYKNFGGV